MAGKKQNLSRSTRGSTYSAPVGASSTSLEDLGGGTPDFNVMEMQGMMAGTPQFYSTGSARIPGQGSGDTVPSMLTPGEAVLTRGAAELLGRDTIDRLNFLASAGNGSKPGHFAEGTSDVDPTAIKPGPQSHFPGQGTIFT